MRARIRPLLRTVMSAWRRGWMQFAGTGFFGRIATRLASLHTPPYKGRRFLAQLTPRGYVAPNAVVQCPHLKLGSNVFVGDRVVIFAVAEDSGPVEFGDRVHMHQDTIIEVAPRGSLKIGADTHVQPRCQFMAYEAPIEIGRHVQIAPYCAFYPYDHSFGTEALIRNQPLRTKGGILIEDDVWLGVGVTVLDGVRIGQGAVIGAGSVITQSIPRGAIASGVPAKIFGMRDQWLDTEPTSRPHVASADTQ